jgi:acyl-coenzyme A thioesterase PaaI-like protein
MSLPWVDRVESNCFGCSPANPSGLALDFRPEGSELTVDLRLDRRYESYPGVVHGGIVALVCDEVMGNLVVLRHGRPAVTTSMRVRYVGTVAVGERYTCRASLVPDTLPVGARAEITDVRGDLIATAIAAYQPVPADASGLPITARSAP